MKKTNLTVTQMSEMVASIDAIGGLTKVPIPLGMTLGEVKMGVADPIENANNLTKELLDEMSDPYTDEEGKEGRRVPADKMVEYNIKLAEIQSHKSEVQLPGLTFEDIGYNEKKPMENKFGIPAGLIVALTPLLTRPKKEAKE